MGSTLCGRGRCVRATGHHACVGNTAPDTPDLPGGAGTAQCKPSQDPCNATTDGRTSEYLRYQLPTLGLSHLSPASVSFHRAVLFFFIPISDSFLRILTHHPHYVKTHPILCASQRSRHAAPSGGRLLARLKSFELHYQTKYCTPGAAIDSTTLTMALQGEQSPT